MRAIDKLLSEFGSEGEHVLLLLRETSELVSYYRRLLERYELDALTGLPGSNKFRDYLDGIETRAASVGVVFFDVNGLKHYNDTMGHQAGDLLIQKASESIHQACGKNVNAFRVGGDEFVAVLTDCTQADIDAFLANWREKLAEVNSINDGIHCSVAAGAALGEGIYIISDVLKLADECMYDDKQRMKSENGCV